MKIQISIPNQNIKTTATLNNSPTSKSIYQDLPIKGSINLWGDEIYFDIPISQDLEQNNKKQEMEFGDLAYWPPGKAFCIFYGKTPSSTSDKPP
mgnify:CR=1 FL=1